MYKLNKIGTLLIKNYCSFILMVLCLFLNSCLKNTSVHNIHGNWNGIYKNQVIIFVFNDDKSCELRFYDGQLDEVIIMKGEFEIDYSKRPIPLSIKHIKQVEFSLHTIIRFINNDSIIISEFSKRSKLRPITFNEEKQLILKRSK